MISADDVAVIEAREEIKRRFGEFVDLHDPRHIDKAMDLITESLDSSGHDFGLSREQREEARDLTAELKALNRRLEEISGLAAQREAAELAAEEESLLDNGVDWVSEKASELRDRRPSRQELWDLTWGAPLTEISRLADARRAGEISTLDFARSSTAQVGRGVRRTFKTIWSVTSSLRHAKAAVKIGAIAVASGSASQLWAVDQVKAGVAVLALWGVGGALWAAHKRRSARHDRQVEHRAGVREPGNSDS